MSTALFIVVRAYGDFGWMCSETTKLQGGTRVTQLEGKTWFAVFIRVKEWLNSFRELLGNSSPNIKLWCCHRKSRELYQSWDYTRASGIWLWACPSISRYTSGATALTCQKGFLQHPLCFPKQESQSVPIMESQAMERCLQQSLLNILFG